MPPARSQCGGQEALLTGTPNNQSLTETVAVHLSWEGQAPDWACCALAHVGGGGRSVRCESPTYPFGKHTGWQLTDVALELAGQDELIWGAPGSQTVEGRLDGLSWTVTRDSGKLTWAPLSWSLRFPIYERRSTISPF